MAYWVAALFFATIVYAPIYTGVTFLGFDTGVEVKNGNPWVVLPSVVMETCQLSILSGFRWISAYGMAGRWPKRYVTRN